MIGSEKEALTSLLSLIVHSLFIHAKKTLFLQLIVKINMF